MKYTVIYTPDHGIKLQQPREAEIPPEVLLKRKKNENQQPWETEIPPEVLLKSKKQENQQPREAEIPPEVLLKSRNQGKPAVPMSENEARSTTEKEKE